MTLPPPKLPAERTPFTDWLHYLVRWITSERVHIKGWQVTETANGKTFIPPNNPPIIGATKQFKVVSDGGDYWNCNTSADGKTADNATVVKVAKPAKLRCIALTATPAGGAVASETIRGTVYTYTYTAVVSGGVTIEYTRGVTGGATETDYMSPPVLVGDIIVAEAFTTSGPATLIGVQWIYKNCYWGS